jgi:hypothetical protein
MPSTHLAFSFATPFADLAPPLFVLVPLVGIDSRTPRRVLELTRFVYLLISPTILMPLAHRHTFAVMN